MAQIVTPNGQIQQVQLTSLAQLGGLNHQLQLAQPQQQQIQQAAQPTGSNTVTSSTWSTSTVTSPTVSVQVRLLLPSSSILLELHLVY